MQKNDSTRRLLSARKRAVNFLRKLDWRRWPLAPKLAAGMIAMILVIVTSVVILSVAREQQVFRTELQQQAELQLDTLGAAGADALYKLQVDSLNSIMQALGEQKIVASGRFYDPQGRLIADAYLSQKAFSLEPDAFGQQLVSTENTLFEWQTSLLLAGKSVIAGHQTLGAISVGLPTASLDSKLDAVRNQAIAIGLAALVAGTLLSLAISQSITQPLRDLTETTQRIAGGDLTRQAAVRGDDEVAALGSSFNIMIGRLRETIAELQKAKEAAEAADRSKTAFLASMSHELRTPLNAILGFAGILRGGMIKGAPALAPAQVDLLKKIELNGKQLRDLVNDVLDLAKIESGQMTVIVTEAHPRVFLDETASALRSLATGKGLTLDLSFTPETPEVVLTDVRKVQQVLTNLLGNAIKFTSVGGVSVKVTTADTTKWQISVQDTGIGIPPDATKLIFEKFRQVDQTDKRAYEGSGLGLAIVKSLVESLHGTILVQSEAGRGSTFIVTLPQRLDSGANLNVKL